MESLSAGLALRDRTTKEYALAAAFPQHARFGAFRRRRLAFRRWRRARPFWGGLLTMLSGLEIFYSTQMSLGGLKFHLGPTGYLSWLIPAVLVAAGALMWFSAAQRAFYAVVAALTAVFSTIAVNLGGFFIGLLLGMVGSALGFAWTPIRPEGPPTPAVSEPETADEGYVEEPVTTRFDDLMTGPLTDTIPRPVNPLLPDAAPGPGEAEPEWPPTPTRPAEPTVPHQRPPSPDSSGVEETPPHGQGGPLPRRSPPLYSIVLILLAVGALGIVGLQGAVPAYAEPCGPSPPTASEPAPTTASPTPPAATSTPALSAASADGPTAPTDSPAADDGGLIGDVVGGVGDTVGDVLGVAATPSPSASISPAAAPPAETRSGEPASSPSNECDASSTGGDGDGGGVPAATPEAPVKRIAAAADQPKVAAHPSRLTGSRVTMSGLSYDGVVELPTVDGTVRALQFSMNRSVTTDFRLETAKVGGALGVYMTKSLTVQGNVKFYASRFAGKLCDPVAELVCVIPLVFTPDAPPPFTVPEMAFADPDIQLVFVESDTLTGTPSLTLTVDA